MKKLSLLIVLMLCFSLSQSFAQFEGKIQFNSYDYKSGQKQKDDDVFVMYITPQRILLQGNKSYKIGASLKPDGLLIRQKEKDFVFLTGHKQAMKISKAGITSFMNMFGDDAKNQAQKTQSDVSYKKTSDTEKINGYNCEKFTFTDKKTPDERSEVWMTKGIDINWGMLAEPWGDKMKEFTGSDLPLDLIFKQGYFPLRLSHYKNDKLQSMAEATEISKSSVARSKVQIPAGMQVVSLQDYLFQQMRKQQ